MEIDIVWTQGKYDSEAFFITNSDVCFISGSFIKFSSIDKSNEISIQGPKESVECMCADSSLNVIAIANSYIHILNYPKLDIISHWLFKRKSCIIQMSFLSDNYLVTLEGIPDLQLTLWNWKTGANLKNISHFFSHENISLCNISVHPVLRKTVVFQHCNGLHFYEIGDLTNTINFTKRTIYMPISGDRTCASVLDERSIEKLTYYDKIQHDSWGLHSDALHNLPLKIICSQFSEHELVEFYDFLMKQERLRVSSVCWIDGNRLIVACLNGDVLLITLDFSVKMIHFQNDLEIKFDFNNYITCMAFNKNGLYLGSKNGDIYIMQNTEELYLTILLSVGEYLTRMKFSPDYENLLIASSDGTLQLLNVAKDVLDIMYISICQDDSPIIGIHSTDTKFCITAKTSGLIEIWDFYFGIPISQYHVKERLKFMEGCPSSSTILVSNHSGSVFIIDISNIKNLRVVEILRPSEKSIKIIKFENFGRLVFLVSEDQHMFICCALPSKGFSMVGYIVLQYDIIDLAVFCKSLEDVIYVAVLVENEQNTSIKKMVISKDFLKKFDSYWQDSSCRIKPEMFDMTTVNLEAKCSSIVIHLLNGLLLFHTKLNKFINIPYENAEKFSLESKTHFEKTSGIFENCQIFLSPSHYLLLVITDNNEITIMKSHNFNVIYKHKFSSFRRVQSCCVFTKKFILIEGFKGVVSCIKLSKEQDMDEMSWSAYCYYKREEEDKVLCTLKDKSKYKSTPWISQMFNKLNESAVFNLKEKRDELLHKFKYLREQIEELASENFSVPFAHQLQSEEFILDENFKEEILESRDDELKKYDLMQGEKLKAKEMDIHNIRKNCMEIFEEKGKILMSFRQNAPIHNYSILKLSEQEKADICYAFKKAQLEKYIERLKLKESLDDGEKNYELLFDETSEKANRVDFEEELKTQPLYLQSREERINYTFKLRHIIRKKRLTFNRQFHAVELLRKETVEKINENNSRIKDILKLIKEERQLWEPKDIDYDNQFEISDTEIENASVIHFEDVVDEPKGLAQHFFKDDWLIKLKILLKQKSQIKLKKENIDLMKKEMEKKHKVISTLVENFENVHNKLAEDKLRCDLEINQYELQLYLIAFSVANFPIYKKWETQQRNDLADLKVDAKKQNKLIRQLETLVTKHRTEIETMQQESDALDEEVSQISRYSRYKQSIYEFYEKRSILVKDTESLNPYEEKMKVLSDFSTDEITLGKYKPQKIPLQTWKQICNLREKRILLEESIKLNNAKMDVIQQYMDKLYSLRDSLKKDVIETEAFLEKMHEIRLRSNFETPMVHPVPDPQLRIKYPDDLNFRESLYLQKFHIEALNGIISNAGNRKLEVVKGIARIEYQIRRNDAKTRIAMLKVRDTKKEIELIKSIPLTKDIQKIVQDPEGFRLQDRIDALDKSKQMEFDEITKQMNQVTKRISNIETKKDILKKSTREKKKEIVTLKGDIAELRKIQNFAVHK